MKFYTITSRFEVEPINVEKYIVERDMHNNVFKFCFDESEKDKFFDATEFNWGFEIDISAFFVGDDNYFYEFKPSGEIIKAKAVKPNMLKKLWNSRIKLAEKAKHDEMYFDENASHLSEAVNFISKSFVGYSKYVYVNRAENYAIPFRFKKAASKNAPLLIYYHGAGALGHDNFKQFFEFINLTPISKLPDCNILIPQATHGVNYSSNGTEKYVKNTVSLVNILQQKFNADVNRTYCYGTSFGGCCVWSAVALYPSVFAAALPVMGSLLQYKKYIPVLNKYTVPIWIVHASNDKNVTCLIDDYVYEQLKIINPNMRYTRSDKYGHKLAQKFYRREPFLQWLFGYKSDLQMK